MHEEINTPEAHEAHKNNFTNEKPNKPSAKRNLSISLMSSTKKRK